MNDNGECVARPMQRWVDPAWRWNAVTQLVEDSSKRCGRLWNDPLIARAVEYRRAVADGSRQRQPNQETTTIKWAFVLRECPSMWQDFMIMVLADCPRSSIATRLCVSEETIATAEALYFDVRSSLGATSWIVAKAIRPNEDNPALTVRLRAAYFGGPAAAEAILNATQRVFLPGEEHKDEFKLALQLKALEALELPLKDEQAAAKFLQFYQRFTSQESRQRLATDRLQLARETEEHRQRTAERRIEAQLARHEQQMAAREEAAAGRAQLERLREHQRGMLALDRSQRCSAEQQAAAERAAASPLAALRWEATEQDSGRQPTATRSAQPADREGPSRTPTKEAEASKTAA